jgi:hypothetical protein
MTQVAQVALCPKCRKAVHAAQSEAWCLGCGTPLDESITTQLPRVVELNAAAARDALIVHPSELSPGERVFRGMIGMGAIFGAVGGGILATMAAVSLLFFRDRVIPGEVPLYFIAPIVWGAISFALGMGYGGLLALVGRGRSFRDVSIVRVATSGALAGLIPATVIVLSPLWGGSVSFAELKDPLLIFPPISAMVATATLLIARRSKPEPDA